MLKCSNISVQPTMRLVAIFFILLLLILAESILSVTGHSLVVRIAMSHSVAHMIELACTLLMGVLSTKKFGNEKLFPVLAQVIYLVTLWGLIFQNMTHAMEVLILSGLSKTFDHVHYVKYMVMCGLFDACLKLAKIVSMKNKDHLMSFKWTRLASTQTVLQGILPGIFTAIAGAIEWTYEATHLSTNSTASPVMLSMTTGGSVLMMNQTSHQILEDIPTNMIDLDPTISIITGVMLILLTASQLKTQALNLLLPVPRNQKIDALKSGFRDRYPHAITHEWHLWGEHANTSPNLILHVKYRLLKNNLKYFSWAPVNKSMNDFFQSKGINNVTIQPEFECI